MPIRSSAIRNSGRRSELSATAAPSTAATCSPTGRGVVERQPDQRIERHQPYLEIVFGLQTAVFGLVALHLHGQQLLPVGCAGFDALTDNAFQIDNRAQKFVGDSQQFAPGHRRPVLHVDLKADRRAQQLLFGLGHERLRLGQPDRLDDAASRINGLPKRRRSAVIQILALEGQRPEARQFGRKFQRIARIFEIGPGRKGRRAIGTCRAFEFQPRLDIAGRRFQVVVILQRHLPVAHEQRIRRSGLCGRRCGAEQRTENQNHSFHRYRIFTL